MTLHPPSHAPTQPALASVRPAANDSGPSRLTTFAFAAPTVPARWLERTQAEVGRKLPRAAVYLPQGPHHGWAYPLENEWGHRYQIWTGYDHLQDLWFSYAIDPAPPALLGALCRYPSIHDLHLFPDGRICLSAEIGCLSLDRTFARTALWCRGASCVRSGLPFMFSVGQTR